MMANNRSLITNSLRNFKINNEVTLKHARAANVCDLGATEELKDLKEMQQVNVIRNL